MTKSLIAVLLLLLLPPLAAQGREGSIAIEPGDEALVIKGWVGDENSFVGNIGVTLEGAAQGSGAVKLNIYKTDLKQAGGAEMIARQAVEITDQTLTPGVPTIYQVKVKGVREPGEYHGRIDLLLSGQQRDAAQHIEVTVVASVRPAFSLLSDNDRLQANLVKCGYDCWLAHRLLPDSAFQNRIELSFEKPPAAPLVVGDITPVVRGDQTRYKLTAGQLELSLEQLPQSQQPGRPGGQAAQTSPQQQGAGGAEPAGANSAPPPATKKILTVPVTIASNDIPADHYTGSIYVTVAGQSNSLKVPVDFNVRSGPLWPLLFLLFSILLGRLFKFMQDKGNAIADALASINRLEFRLRDVHAEDAEIVTPMLRAARDLVNQEKAAEAAAAVNAISARLSTLGELRQIEARLTGKESSPAVPPILSDVRQAREHIQFQQDDKAKALLTKIKDALVALAAAPSLTDTDTSDLTDAAERADAASAAAAVLGKVRKTVGGRLRRILTTLSGLSDEFRAEATLFIARPILWLALLLGLLALGLKTLYIDNPVFGANPFTDFLGLIFWGISADTASRTLSGLRINNADRPAGR